MGQVSSFLAKSFQRRSYAHAMIDWIGHVTSVKLLTTPNTCRLPPGFLQASYKNVLYLPLNVWCCIFPCLINLLDICQNTQKTMDIFKCIDLFIRVEILSLKMVEILPFWKQYELKPCYNLWSISTFW